MSKSNEAVITTILDWSSLSLPPEPPKNCYVVSSYGGGELVRAPVRRRRKRLDKKIRRRLHFMRRNSIASAMADLVRREARLEPGERAWRRVAQASVLFPAWTE